ncbi:MAG: serine hydrolase domain-containing protein [Hyphomonadaceae bacterium]
MITRRPLLLGAAAASLTAASAYAQSGAGFMGEWHGVLDLGSQRLRLRLVVAEGPTATLFSVDQGNNAIPVGTTTIDGDAIVLDLPVIRASYSGRLTGGRIEGQFTQGGTRPLVFQREEVVAAAPDALTQERLAALRAEAGAPALAAAALSRGGASLAFADGVRALGRTEPVTTGDVWHLGSITKSMTATLVARCVDAGALAWTDTVGAILGDAIPSMRAEYRDVTFRHLLSHRAGLASNLEWSEILAFPRENEDARQDRIAYARLGLTRDPEGPKEQHFEYSNTGYVIVGAMLEAKFGAPWETLIRQRVFDPLGMASAGQGVPGTPGAYDQPVGHGPGLDAVAAGRRDGPVSPYPPGSGFGDNPAVLGPAGRVHANFDDVLKYLCAHRDRTDFLSADSWRTLQTPPFGGPYAMGWQADGERLWHNGSNTYWYAEVMVDRARGIAAAAAANDGRVELMRPAVGAALIGAAQAVA